ncbi:MAG: hypothetical protein AAF492_31025 [Verrucomicrobiota bacterium]
MKKFFCITLALLAGPILACQVPVFRYALERWPPDMFQLVIYHSEPLLEKEQTVVNYLKERAENEEAPAFVRLVFWLQRTCPVR